MVRMLGSPSVRSGHDPLEATFVPGPGALGDAVQWGLDICPAYHQSVTGLPVSQLDHLSSVGRGRRSAWGGSRSLVPGGWHEWAGAFRLLGGRTAGRAIRVPEPMARPAVRDPVAADGDAAGAVTALYAAHYRSLVR